jgi:hypothetical protein
MSAFGPPAPKFELYYATVDKQTGKIAAVGMSAPGVLADASEMVVWKLDRLGRSVKGLVDLVNELQERHVHFKSLTDGKRCGPKFGRVGANVIPLGPGLYENVGAIWGAHTKRKFKYGKELSPRGLECESTQ